MKRILSIILFLPIFLFSQSPPEIGINDFQISDMGTNGNTNIDATEPSIAYNSTDNEYLVVWKGDGGTNNEYEIFGQRLAADGTEIGTNDFQISDMGPNGSTSYNAQKPFVVYNSTDNEYLVVWIGDDNTAPLVNNEYEIFGQRLAADGSEVGSNDFRISDMGPDGDVGYGVLGTKISAVYNSINNQYLVVWTGSDNIAPLVAYEYEIFGQLLAADGSEVGSNDFRISDMGTNGNLSFQALAPSVTFNPLFNNYLVVWNGDDNTAPLVNNESEIFGQRLSSIGVEIGTNDFQISDMGPDGDVDYDAGSASVTYNTTNNEYLVVWHGDDDTAPLVDEEFEIFGQRLSVVGGEIGTNDFRISDMGINGQTNKRGFTPNVSYNATDNEYLIAWVGEDTGDANQRAYGQYLSNTGLEIGDNDFSMSESVWDAEIYPFVVHNSGDNESLVVWSMTSNVLPFVYGEYEIFGQRLGGTSLPLPIELTQFTAKRNKHSVDLNWETATEVNNKGFDIERSSDGYDFKKIGWQNGKGNSNILEQYSYVDSDIQKGQIYYYRLKQIDYNNQFSYSKIISIELPNEINNSLRIYPNPATDLLYIEGTNLSGSVVMISNHMGQMVKKFLWSDDGLNIKELPKGIYFISINNKVGQKLVKLNN